MTPDNVNKATELCMKSNNNKVQSLRLLLKHTPGIAHSRLPGEQRKREVNECGIVICMQIRHCH
jgi:hypothetical protein